MASSPKAFATMQRCLFTELQVELAEFAFNINWHKGKRDLMQRMRDKLAKRCNGDHVVTHAGRDVVSLDRGAGMLYMVDSYRHAGTTVTLGVLWFQEALARTSSAMTAHTPLAPHTFWFQLDGCVCSE